MPNSPWDRLFYKMVFGEAYNIVLHDGEGWQVSLPFDGFVIDNFLHIRIASHPIFDLPHLVDLFHALLNFLVFIKHNSLWRLFFVLRKFTEE